MTIQILKVNGMHCASCASVITKKISTLPYVNSISVNYANEKAKIDFKTDNFSIDELNHTIKAFGYSFVSPDD
jgi:Cu2+-exporting ATPase/Cu+-exporting ATPase